MKLYLLLLGIIACWQVFVLGYMPKPKLGMIKVASPSESSKELIIGGQKSRTLSSQLQSTTKEIKEKEFKFKKYKCQGCAFVYDEEKGFKRRYPPGTKFEPLPTFMCPVCGAAKDQFHEYHED